VERGDYLSPPYWYGRYFFFLWRPELEKVWSGVFPAPTSMTEAAQPPQRRKPGTKYKDDWPWEMAPEMVRVAVRHPEMLQNIDGLLLPHMKKFLQDQIGWAPSDSKAIREKIVFLLKLMPR
jgi:hypothetical protein